MKKLLFLYNTHAGKGLLKNRLAAVQDALAAAGWDVTIHPTQGAGDATAVAAARAGEFDRIVCSGGDGTLHEVVAGLMGLENRPEVGYIPAGTTNDFAKNLSLPRGMEAMARVAAAGVPRPVDIGSFNDRYFIYVAAFGAFTDVAYSTPQPVKIDTMARNLIRLSGHEPDVDIKIVYTGLRPGEKLYEELLMSEEGLQSTENKLIHIGKPIEFDEDLFVHQLEELNELSKMDSPDIKKRVAEIVPTYHMEEKRQ